VEDARPLDNSARTIGGVAGIALVVTIFLNEYIPLTIAGTLFSGTLDAQAVLQHYNHPTLVWVFWFVGLAAALFFPLFIFSLYRTLKDAAKTPITEFLVTTGIAVAMLEVFFVLLQATLQWTLISLSGQYYSASDVVSQKALAATVLGLFRFWDLSYNTIAFWTQVVWVSFLSIVILKTTVLPRWLGWLGIPAGLLSVLNTLAIPLSFSAGPLILPGNFAFGAWILASSLVLLRAKEVVSGLVLVVVVGAWVALAWLLGSGV
jgi:hypothetical protein